MFKSKIDAYDDAHVVMLCFQYKPASVWEYTERSSYVNSIYVFNIYTQWLDLIAP